MCTTKQEAEDAFSALQANFPDASVVEVSDKAPEKPVTKSEADLKREGADADAGGRAEEHAQGAADGRSPRATGADRRRQGARRRQPKSRRRSADAHAPPLRRHRARAAAPGRRPRRRPDELPARREQLTREFAELQFDLGGLAYEMAIRDHFRVDLLARRAARLQELDAELGAIERLERIDGGGAAGACPNCDALYPARRRVLLAVRAPLDGGEASDSKPRRGEERGGTAPGLRVGVRRRSGVPQHLVKPLPCACP